MTAANDDTGRDDPPPPPPTLPQWQTAVHEAGHACAALLLGVPNVGCAIFDCGGASGPGELKPPDLARYTPEQIEPQYRADAVPDLLREATWTAAGDVAADLATRPPHYPTQVTAGDSAIIRAVCRRVFPGCDAETEHAFGQLAIARARALLLPNMPRVLRVAERLWAATRLTGDDVAAAMFPEAMRKETP